MSRIHILRCNNRSISYYITILIHSRGITIIDKAKTRPPILTRFHSCHKVIKYVRTCTNAHNPYFNQCVRIRSLVKALAKKDRAGEERIWRSFAQELKPSHAKCRKPKFDR